MLSEARVSCDVLVVTRDAASVPTQILMLPEVRAGAVIVLDKGLDQRPMTTDVLRNRHVAGAWAVALVARSDTADFVVGFMEHFSHATTFDDAVASAAGIGDRTACCVMADPRIMQPSRRSTSARPASLPLCGPRGPNVPRTSRPAR